MIEIKVPSITSNEDTVTLMEVLINENQFCKQGLVLCILESTKTAFELVAERSGHVCFISKEGDELSTDQVIGLIDDKPIEDTRLEHFSSTQIKKQETGLVITKKAQIILNKNQIDPIKIKKDGVIKVSDVKNYLDQNSSTNKDNTLYEDFEKIIKSYDTDNAGLGDIKQLKQTLTLSQKIYSDKWNRQIPVIDILFDRWSAGENQSFGSETNISHLSHVTGDVVVGERTYIGPFTIIDGSGGLKIGNCCSIAAGVHIYSHDTISRALSGGKKEPTREPTKIGNCCFLGPNSVITKGVTIGDHCFVGANSVITADIAPNTAISGNPAEIIGKVKLNQDGSVKIHNKINN